MDDAKELLGKLDQALKTRMLKASNAVQSKKNESELTGLAKYDKIGSSLSSTAYWWRDMSPA
jgi:hypothetical protein